jgi:hypothetical protein
MEGFASKKKAKLFQEKNNTNIPKQKCGGTRVI